MASPIKRVSPLALVMENRGLRQRWKYAQRWRVGLANVVAELQADAAEARAHDDDATAEVLAWMAGELGRDLLPRTTEGDTKNGENVIARRA